MTNFFEHSRAEIAQFVNSPSIAKKLFQSVFRNEILLELEPFSFPLPEIVESFKSGDRTERFLLRLSDGEMIESVIIPTEGRLTFCISSQVGCALGCTFCLTGLLGLKRNLSTAEIVAQVVLLARQRTNTDRFSVVFMGMGEPLQNYDNVMKAIAIMNDDHGFNLSLHRITLSTAGLVPALERLVRESLFPNLSISLTGATNEKRDRMMPVNRRHPIESVLSVVRAMPPQRQKRVMFEYVMIEGLTDSLEDAQHLLNSLNGLRVKVNLIPLNPAPELALSRSGDDTVLRFHDFLLERGLATFVRKSRGGDVSGACGQLMKRAQPR
jgi:23S rRNA (adenine2503-C2)-methyltransferase